MNERIRELWAQAAFELNQEFLTCPENWDELMKAKFAELLIRECARVAGQEQIYNERHEIPVNIEQSVLEHFGVSE